MGERKVLNKYSPSGYDPAKIPRRKQTQTENQQIKVCVMLPINIACGACGTCMYRGTKFNSRKEDCVGETYLGIQVIRFYIKCTCCSAEITFKTNPQNSATRLNMGLDSYSTCKIQRNLRVQRSSKILSCLLLDVIRCVRSIGCDEN